jgi:hypothetical protein
MQTAGGDSVPLETHDTAANAPTPTTRLPVMTSGGLKVALEERGFQCDGRRRERTVARWRCTDGRNAVESWGSQRRSSTSPRHGCRVNAGARSPQFADDELIETVCLETRDLGRSLEPTARFRAH